MNELRDKIEKVFFDVSKGIDVRFHNGDFFLHENEIEVITEYATLVAKEAEEKGAVDAKDLKNIVRMIEVLEKSDQYETIVPLQRIFNKIEQINPSNE